MKLLEKIVDKIKPRTFTGIVIDVKLISNQYFVTLENNAGEVKSFEHHEKEPLKLGSEQTYYTLAILNSPRFAGYFGF